MCSGARNADGPISSRAVRGVLGGGEVGVRARAAPRRQLQHLRAQCRHHPAVGGDTVFVELIEVFHQRVVRLAVFGDRLGMPDADTEQEASRVGPVDPMERVGDRLGRVRPDVDDAGGYLQRRGRFENGLHPRQFGGGRTADPDGPVTQGFDVFGLGRRDAASERSEPAEIGLAYSRIGHGCPNLPSGRSYSAFTAARPWVASPGCFRCWLV